MRQGRSRPGSNEGSENGSARRTSLAADDPPGIEALHACGETRSIDGPSSADVHLTLPKTSDHRSIASRRFSSAADRLFGR